MWGIEPISSPLEGAIVAQLTAIRMAFRLTRSQANGQALDDITQFIDHLCAFVLSSPIQHPDQQLRRVYERSTWPALVHYRALSQFGWNGFFRLDPVNQTLKLVLVTQTGSVPLTNLQAFLDGL